MPIIDVTEDGKPLFFVNTDLSGAASLGTIELHPGGSLGVDLTGTGWRVGMWESFLPNKNHVELSPRTGIQSGLPWFENDPHATGVAGVLGASGNRVDSNGNPIANSLKARGMAPGIHIRAYSNDDIFSLDTWVRHELDHENMTISNHSYAWNRGWQVPNTSWVWYGDSEYGKYVNFTRIFDHIYYSHPTYLAVWAAGNHREGNPHGWRVWNTIADWNLCKNVLTVGAVDQGYELTYYSSTGPTSDGRIKPDVVAFGEGVHSTYTSGTTGYANIRGTSAACPQVAGSLALVQQLYHNIHGANILSSSLKGLAIHTATDLDIDMDDYSTVSNSTGVNGPSAAGNHTGPDYGTGWGIVNVEKAASLLIENSKLPRSKPYFKEVLLQNGEQARFSVSALGGEPLKVTICWTDPAGVVGASKSLIHDIDVKLTRNGTIYYPWTLDPAVPTNSAVRDKRNNTDNVEQVLIDVPLEGQVYEVEISHQGTIAPQMVSVFVSGNEGLSSEYSAMNFLQIVDFAVGDADDMVTWIGTVGEAYRIQRSVDLSSWVDVTGDIVALNEINAYQVVAPNLSKYFYRVEKQ